LPNATRYWDKFIQKDQRFKAMDGNDNNWQLFKIYLKNLEVWNIWPFPHNNNECTWISQRLPTLHPFFPSIFCWIQNTNTNQFKGSLYSYYLNKPVHHHHLALYSSRIK
jgi:hypothetical protein